MSGAGFWIAIDPGETVGFSIWRGKDLIWADQLPMWKFADAIYEWAAQGQPPGGELLGIPQDANSRLEAMVVEQWQLYPWELQNLAWDECRTARVIGALTLICRQFGIQFILQGADIKEGAIAAGAEAMFLEPVHENRHANDSIMHGTFYLAKNGGSPV